VGETVLDGFTVAQIEPLEPEAIERFLEHWCAALFPESPGQAGLHLAKLSEALRSTPEIRRMARNPVMLTALAVVHWNERRLPEQRADLYASILTWLSRSREKRAGREPAERCLTLLAQLALAMQDQPEGRKVELSQGEAADILTSHFPGRAEAERRQKAWEFIDQEEVDSGIIVSRGSEVRFWHLTFQEYLAARAVAGLADCEQHRLLLAGNKIYRHEWREVALLLGCVLRQQGSAKVDGLITQILNGLGERASLAERARCVGLLGAMVRDLRPLGYDPADARYGSTLESVLGIFDAKKAQTVEFGVRLEAAEALGQAGDPRLNKENWVTIEADKFRMGAQREDPSNPNYDHDAGDNEVPVHEVYLEEYEIGRYPVTVEEYRRFVENEGYTNPRWWQAGDFGRYQEPVNWDEQLLYPNRPVVGVSWYEAVAYCASAGARLPTEAEWERAARGVSGKKYPWGDGEPDTEGANYYKEKVDHPTPVGLFPRGATPEGIADMAGNVWEWVADWYEEDYRRRPPDRNPKGPQSGFARVLRGGCWFSVPWLLRATYRGRNVPEFRGNNMGFRCARRVFP
jgi:formylglycine-generating enzyme required for sulfatase activity